MARLALAPSRPNAPLPGIALMIGGLALLTLLLWSILFDFLLWGDVPGIWLLAGATLLVGSGLYLFYYAQAA